MTQSGSGARVLADFALPSAPENARRVMDRVADAVRELGLPPRQLERLKTAVSEAAMNAIEHGNHNDPELPVAVQVIATDAELAVRITDQGGDDAIPEPETPDLDAKVAGLQTPRGWGLFLIKNMVDDMRTSSDERHHTIELVLRLDRERGRDGNAPR